MVSLLCYESRPFSVQYIFLTSCNRVTKYAGRISGPATAEGGLQMLALSSFPPSFYLLPLKQIIKQARMY